MLTRWWVMLGLLLLVVVAVVGGYPYERPLQLTAAGYAAQNACAVDHFAGRSDPQVDLPSNPLVPVLRPGEGDNDTTKGSSLGVLPAQRAVFTERFGCTLATSRRSLPAASPAFEGPTLGRPRRQDLYAGEQRVPGRSRPWTPRRPRTSARSRTLCSRAAPCAACSSTPMPSA